MCTGAMLLFRQIIIACSKWKKLEGLVNRFALHRSFLIELHTYGPLINEVVMEKRTQEVVDKLESNNWRVSSLLYDTNAWETNTNIPLQSHIYFSRMHIAYKPYV